jgi:hypothetical protein
MRNGEPERRKPDSMKTVSLIMNGLMTASLIVSITVAVQKTGAADVNSLRIDGLVNVVDSMKDVDTGLLAQITDLRGTTTTDIALLNERIVNITKLLEEIKAIVMRRP